MINRFKTYLRNFLRKGRKIEPYIGEPYIGEEDDQSVLLDTDENMSHMDKDDEDNNFSIRNRQGLTVLLLAVGIVLGIVVIIKIVQGKRQEKVVKEVSQTVRIEVAADSVDPQRMWHGHFEQKLNNSKESFEERLIAVEKSFAAKEKELEEETKSEITKLQEQVKYAKEELSNATAELERVRKIQLERPVMDEPAYVPANMTSSNLFTEREFDHPKSSKVYIPETSYVTGYLLGGIAVSTGLNAPTENATPVIIKLSSRGNLPKNFKLDISTCRLLGSSYGDISSERAVIRLEKMVCTDPKTELVTTSEIAGVIFGPDGMNGIKGQVVATSNKHIKNAMVGGIISGLSSSAKGQEGMAITSLGAVNTKKKGFGAMAGEGLLTGTSTAAEKIADYYLRQAEAMSPVLTIPGGVKVDVIFTKGFYVGEVSTHRQIESLRRSNQNISSSQNSQSNQYGDDQ